MMSTTDGHYKSKLEMKTVGTVIENHHSFVFMKRQKEKQLNVCEDYNDVSTY